MINDKTEFIAEGIRILLDTRRFGDNESARKWVEKYPEVFPKRIPFGGSIE